MKAEYNTLTAVKSRVFKEQNMVSVPLNLDKEKAEKVMSVSGNVGLIDCKVNQGEVVYIGRITYSVLYLADEIERVESGMEFTFKLNGDFSDSDRANVLLSASDFSVRINGNVAFIESLITADIEVFCEDEINYLKEVDDLNKVAKSEYVRKKTCVNEFDLDDEFDTDKVYKVLGSSATAKLKGVEHNGGVAILDGDVFFSVLLLHFNQKNDIIRETRVIPFRFEVETSTFAKEKCNVAVKVDKLNLKVYIDEERDRSVVESSIKLSVTTDFYEVEELDYIDDVYSPTVELDIKKTPVTFKCLEDEIRLCKRISGKLTAFIPENSRFLTTCSDRIEVININFDEAVTVDAMLYLDAIMVDGEQNTVSVACKSPLNFTFDNIGIIKDVRVSLVDCSYKFRSGNIEFDGEVLIEYSVYKECSFDLICDINEGKEKKANDGVISVYVAQEGETEWDVTKALGVSIDEIYELNAQLQFPLEKSEKIICFRQIK